jgi:hypothetical protein
LIAKNNFCASPFRTALGAWAGVPVEFAPDVLSNQAVGGFFFSLHFLPRNSRHALFEVSRSRKSNRARRDICERVREFS